MEKMTGRLHCVWRFMGQSWMMSQGMFTCHSPTAFNEYADIIQGAGKTSITHMRGNLRTACEIVKRMPSLRGLVLSAGDATPYGTPVDTIKAISRWVELLGPASLTGNLDTNEAVARVATEFQ